MFILAILYRVIVLFFSLTAFWRRNKDEASPSWQLQQQYVFLFPVFCEQEIIVSTLKYYEKFLTYNGNIQLLFVTTTKEKTNPSTQALIQAFVRQSLYSTRIKYVCCPEIQGTKATQVNFGIDYIRKAALNNPYIVSLDCDARIQWKDFVLTDKYITENSNSVIYSFLPQPILAGAHSLIVKAVLLHHGERMIAFEYPSIDSWFNYPMGATLIMGPKLWQYLDHIPEPNDDLSLKYVLEVYRLKYVSLPYFTEVQVPPNVKNVYRQMIPIFSGVFSYFKTLRSYHISLTIWRIIQGLGWYFFFLLEYVSIVYLLLALSLGDIFFVCLFGLQITIDLFSGGNYHF